MLGSSAPGWACRRPNPQQTAHTSFTSPAVSGNKLRLVSLSDSSLVLLLNPKLLTCTGIIKHNEPSNSTKLKQAQQQYSEKSTGIWITYREESSGYKTGREKCSRCRELQFERDQNWGPPGTHWSRAEQRFRDILPWFWIVFVTTWSRRILLIFPVLQYSYLNTY